jgi:hypothetical protein
MAEPILAPSPGALRMRRHRDRRKRGCCSLTIEIREAEVSELIRCGYLAADERGDGRAVRQAVHKLLDRIFSAR